MPKEQGPKESSCTGKMAHPTRLEASNHADRVRGMKHKKLNIYKCQFCRNWHVGGAMRNPSR